MKSILNALLVLLIAVGCSKSEDDSPEVNLCDFNHYEQMVKAEPRTGDCVDGVCVKYYDITSLIECKIRVDITFEFYSFGELKETKNFTKTLEAFESGEVKLIYLDNINSIKYIFTNVTVL